RCADRGAGRVPLRSSVYVPSSLLVPPVLRDAVLCLSTFDGSRYGNRGGGALRRASRGAIRGRRRLRRARRDRKDLCEVFDPTLSEYLSEAHHFGRSRAGSNLFEECMASDEIIQEQAAERDAPRRPRRPVQAYRNESFLNSREARALRILAEYLEPKSRFERYRVDDTIVFMGSARFPSRETAEAALAAAEAGDGDLERARRDMEMSTYYEAARELASRLTHWSKKLDHKERRFVVCTGGGPGIMEAANRGAAEAKGVNVGLTISIPVEEFDNKYVTRELSFHFHYFFMRKFWFYYLAKAVIIFPGGFGTL